MTFPDQDGNWRRSESADGEWIDYLYAFHLFRSGYSADSYPHDNGKIHAEVLTQFPMWICTQESERQGDWDRFSFSFDSDGTRWHVRNKHTSLVTIGFRGKSTDVTISAEIRGQHQDFISRPPSILGIFSASPNIGELNMFLATQATWLEEQVFERQLSGKEPNAPFVRLLQIQSSPRVGFLFPKTYGWKVIPATLGFGDGRPRYVNRPISIQDFVLNNY
ncbi:hypothetical protein [Herbaspirillum chlorophenolicum]|uniref:hypothetical protein n=1 Tax=Herbaspirillum chlorophenolicum TaxID=211589 RepID=UPI00067BB7A7|nr:hypothetical protein [Herbaspirillum chlorophenolicum]